jgi:hypothetical protein
MGLVFNSDILFIPDIFNDLTHGGHFRDWVIATTGMFFPDWLVFFIASKITTSLYFQFLIIACINILLLFLSVKQIYAQFFPQKINFVFSLTSILFFLFFVTKALEPYIFITVLGQHAGGFIIGLVYIYLQLRLNEKEKEKNVLVLFMLITFSILMGASDVLFIVQFLIPVLVTNTIMYWKKNLNVKKLISYSFIPLILSIIAFLVTNKVLTKSKIFNLLKFSNLNFISIPELRNKLAFFLKNINVFNQFYWPLVGYVTFYFAIICMSFYWIFKEKKINAKSLFWDRKTIFLSLFFTSSVAITILSYIFLDKDLAIRHLEPFFYFPILFFFFIGSFLKNNKSHMKLFNQSAALMMIFFLMYYISDFKKIHTIKKVYYPYEVSCIDNALKNYDHFGVANYWTARPFTLFSSERLHIIEVFNDLSPFKLATNLVKVSDKNTYSFIIMNKVPIIPTPNALEFDETDIVSINGLPKKKIICGGKLLLIYSSKTFRIPVFKNKNDYFYWPVSILSSQFNHSIVKSKARYVKASDGPGFISFGPYVTLCAGKYRVQFSYTSSLSDKTKIGYWDISSNIANSMENKFGLFGTNNKYKKISHDFKVLSSKVENKYEFRIYSDGKSNMYMKGIKLIKLDNLKT